ncbi:AraC family transcriptional regulator [Alkalimarinus sediminis]|uniref:AraC family transcriptional regulator n=1 Tax=Alkalimarinus sediminis TaxID=1632866 RepID=A0A9E8HII8_9ALTE|nr:AraC family transcriptional regulator [Alkalimarinus sediminis]UZW73351.1 AraC family transcriptional regulator [Alkalimarinus sediminis]
MSELKDAGVMIRLAVQAMVKAGVDIPLLMSKLGIDESYLKTAHLRTPHNAQPLFWGLLEDQTGDPDIGLHLGQHLPTFKGQVIEYLFLSSPTFGDGIRRALNYQRLISDVAESSLTVESDISYIKVITAPGGAPSIRHFNECFAQAVIDFFKSITDDAFTPEHLEFDHNQPQNVDEVKRVFGCDVKFDCDENRIYFDTALLDRPSPHAEPELLALHEQFASEQVARIEKEDIVVQVNRVIAELLDSGDLTLEAVAERLEIKPRSLRTKLADIGTNFNQLLADFRYNLARRLLADTYETIDEIVYLTGFSEPSTFYRAFKRWSGMTPIEYRKSRQ